MQRIYLLAQAGRSKADPELWFAQLFAAQTSVYDQAVVIMSARLSLSREVEIPPVKSRPQIESLLKIWQAELRPLPEPEPARVLRQSWQQFADSVKTHSKARQKAEEQFGQLVSPKGSVTDYGAVIPPSDRVRKEMAEARQREGKVYIGPRRIRQPDGSKANAWPLHWAEA